MFSSDQDRFHFSWLEGSESNTGSDLDEEAVDFSSSVSVRVKRTLQLRCLALDALANMFESVDTHRVILGVATSVMGDGGDSVKHIMRHVYLGTRFRERWLSSVLSERRKLHMSAGESSSAARSAPTFEPDKPALWQLMILLERHGARAIAHLACSSTISTNGASAADAVAANMPTFGFAAADAANAVTSHPRANVVLLRNGALAALLPLTTSTDVLSRGHANAALARLMLIPWAETGKRWLRRVTRRAWAQLDTHLSLVKDVSQVLAMEAGVAAVRNTARAAEEEAADAAAKGDDDWLAAKMAAVDVTSESTNANRSLPVPDSLQSFVAELAAAQSFTVAALADLTVALVLQTQKQEHNAFLERHHELLTQMCHVQPMLRGIMFSNKQDEEDTEAQKDSDDDDEDDEDDEDVEKDVENEEEEAEEEQGASEESDVHDGQVSSSENELEMEDHDGGPELAHRARRVSRRRRTERLQGSMRWSDAVDSLTEGVVDSLQQFGIPAYGGGIERRGR